MASGFSSTRKRGASVNPVCGSLKKWTSDKVSRELKTETL